MIETIIADPAKLREFYEVGWTIVDDMLSADEVHEHLVELERCI